jgi:histidinol-phosphatase (PHP family)
MIDYHIHTNYSFDGESTMEALAEAAVSRGISEIAFTDHVDLLYEDGVLRDDRFLRQPDYDRFDAEFDALKTKYSGKLRIVYGVEVSVASDAVRLVEGFLRSRPFEFVIGSLHDCEGADIFYPQFYEGKTKKQAYEFYFNEMRNVAGLIDGIHVLGHLDYIERYGRYADKTLDYDDYRDAVDGVLRAVIENGKGIEVNTSRIRYGLRRDRYDAAHPQFKILRRYRELGGEIVTIGSDAHNAAYVGAHYKDAVECLAAAGFKAAAVWREGKPRFVDL